jgi:hypothetical protein
MRIRIATAALAAAVGLSALTAWVFAWPFEKAVYLAPIIVAFFGCALGIVVFWSRVAYVQVRDSGNRRLLLALAVGVLTLVALLTVLGVELPREGG